MRVRRPRRVADRRAARKSRDRAEADPREPSAALRDPVATTQSISRKACRVSPTLLNRCVTVTAWRSRCRRARTPLYTRGKAKTTKGSVDILRIPTVTGIDIELRIAGTGGRSFAFLIDWHLRALLALGWVVAAV